MKIIIIGANGMLGQELAKTFKEHSPLLWDLEQVDITKKDEVFEKITKERPDVVINSAAFNDVDGAEEKEEIANAVNGYGPGNIACAVQSYGGMLVHYSTDYVFKGDNKDGYKEDDAPDPQSAYARSKFLGEQEVQSNCDKCYIIRLSRLFGKPAAAQGAKRSFIDVMLQLAQEKDKLNIVNEERSCPTYAPDLARRTKDIIDQKKEFGIYHAGNSGACTWFEFAQYAFTIKNINVTIYPVPTSFYPRPAARPPYSELLNTKLPPMRSWKEALKEYLE